MMDLGQLEEYARTQTEFNDHLSTLLMEVHPELKERIERVRAHHGQQIADARKHDVLESLKGRPSQMRTLQQLGLSSPVKYHNWFDQVAPDDVFYRSHAEDYLLEMFRPMSLHDQGRGDTVVPRDRFDELPEYSKVSGNEQPFIGLARVNTACVVFMYQDHNHEVHLPVFKLPSGGVYLQKEDTNGAMGLVRTTLDDGSEVVHDHYNVLSLTRFKEAFKKILGFYVDDIVESVDTSSLHADIKARYLTGRSMTVTLDDVIVPTPGDSGDNYLVVEFENNDYSGISPELVVTLKRSEYDDLSEDQPGDQFESRFRNISHMTLDTVRWELPLVPVTLLRAYHQQLMVQHDDAEGQPKVLVDGVWVPGCYRP